MLKKFNQLLNIIIGLFVGVNVGHAAFIFWKYKKYPDYYAMQPAPWYTSIIVYGAFTAVILLVAMLLKWLIRKRLNEIRRNRSGS